MDAVWETSPRMRKIFMSGVSMVRWRTGNDIQLNEAHSSMKNDNTVEVSPIDQHR